MGWFDLIVDRWGETHNLYASTSEVLGGITDLKYLAPINVANIVVEGGGVGVGGETLLGVLPIITLGTSIAYAADDAAGFNFSFNTHPIYDSAADRVFTHSTTSSNNQITVNYDGIYKFTGYITIGTRTLFPFSTLTSYQVLIQYVVNGTNISFSRTNQGYIQHDTCNYMVVDIDWCDGLSAGDVVSLKGYRLTSSIGADVVANQANLSITMLSSYLSDD